MAGLICFELDITDANDFIYPFASVATSQIQSVANLPVNGWGYLMVIRQAYNQYLQIYFCASSSDYYIRSNREGIWYSWRIITLTTLY